MTSQHIKHHKLQKLLRPSGIVFLINITTEEKKAGIDNVSTVSTLLFKNTWMTFRHSKFKSKFGATTEIRHQPSDAVLKLAWVTVKKPSCRSVDIKAFARSSQRWSHKRRAIHTYDTRSRGPACAGHQQHQHVHLVPSTGRKGPWVYPPVMVPPSISVHSEQTWWIMTNMNILLYEYNILII